MGIYGQDWASYQSAAPDTAGLSFAFVKITEGATYTNPEWQAQRDHAKSKGLVFGGYHYPHMGQSVQLEADHFLAQVAWKPGDLVCLDWEGYDAANAGVSHARQVIYKDQFLRYVKSHLPHNPVGMYCNADYWRNVDTTGYYGDFLWIATAGLPAGHPGIAAPWLFHQYSAATVDHDYCHLPSPGALRDWALSFAAPPAPPPAPSPVPAPPVSTLKEPTMLMITIDRATVPKTTPVTAWPGDFVILETGTLIHIASPADEAKLAAKGVPGPITVTYARYQELLAGK